jgi:hypothetical protein
MNIAHCSLIDTTLALTPRALRYDECASPVGWRDILDDWRDIAYENLRIEV